MDASPLGTGRRRGILLKVRLRTSGVQTKSYHLGVTRPDRQTVLIPRCVHRTTAYGAMWYEGMLWSIFVLLACCPEHPGLPPSNIYRRAVVRVWWRHLLCKHKLRAADNLLNRRKQRGCFKELSISWTLRLENNDISGQAAVTHNADPI